MQIIKMCNNYMQITCKLIRSNYMQITCKLLRSWLIIYMHFDLLIFYASSYIYMCVCVCVYSSFHKKKKSVYTCVISFNLTKITLCVCKSFNLRTFIVLQLMPNKLSQFHPFTRLRIAMI